MGKRARAPALDARELLRDATPLSQGAEARVSKGIWKNQAVAVKHRFRKRYRHPDLDAKLNRARERAECRAYARAKEAGIPVPHVLGVDEKNHVIVLEWCDGGTLKAALNDDRYAPEDKRALCVKFASTIAQLHKRGLTHGDLTTSNAVVREDRTVALIDFGLAATASKPSRTWEDRGVDLYVLQRAFESTHPDASELLSCVLETYFAEADDDGRARSAYERVAARGRKRVAFG